jgi:hypothetical protein
MIMVGQAYVIELVLLLVADGVEGEAGDNWEGGEDGGEGAWGVG